jgi:hypothetical protein
MNAVTTEFTALDYLSSSTFAPKYSQVLVALTAFSSASPLAGSLVLGISGAVSLLDQLASQVLLCTRCN